MSVVLKVATIVITLLPSASIVSLGDDWRVQVPELWTVHRSDGNGFLLSRDGVGIQSIRGRCRSARAPFTRLEESVSPTEPPLDYAQKVVAGLLRSYASYVPGLIAVQPLVLGDRRTVNGNIVTLEYHNEKGVRQRVVSASFVRGDTFCTITMQAPTVFFLDRDRPAFEQVIESLRRR